jgi:hypothetical protein
MSLQRIQLKRKSMKMNPQPLTTRVEMESRLTVKLKASYRAKPEQSSWLYYHLLVEPYSPNIKYKEKNGN